MARRASKTPAQLDDTARLDLLERAGGFVCGMAGGKPAVRILGTNDWHPTLRNAIDLLALKSTLDDLQ
jgi:hypothetical protein